MLKSEEDLAPNDDANCGPSPSEVFRECIGERALLILTTPLAVPAGVARVIIAAAIADM